MLLGFHDYEAQGRRLAEALGLPFAPVEIHRFPDGESKVTLPAQLPAQVVVCRTLDQPNDKLVELMLVTRTARELGARHITLVAPYLCYMRQDIAFHAGEAVSQKIIGGFLAELFDAVITVDPHLHRIERLEQAIPRGQAIALTAAPAMIEFLAQHVQHPMLIGPDAESEQWVRAMAEPAGLEYAVATKERLGDRSVRTKLPEMSYQGRSIVLVDDMASTGRTLIAVASQLKFRGAAAIHCLVTHALFTDDTTRQLHEAGIERIWSTDSISHPSNVIHLAPLLAQAVHGLKLRKL
ncbi:MAG: ribose-phosphate pyrophosphokinase [Thiohalomonadaceae bacterium]